MDRSTKDLFKTTEVVIEEGSVISVSVKGESFVMMSKSDYDALIESIYLSSNPGYHKTLLDGKTAPCSDFVNEEEASW